MSVYSLAIVAYVLPSFSSASLSYLHLRILLILRVDPPSSCLPTPLPKYASNTVLCLGVLCFREQIASPLDNQLARLSSLGVACGFHDACIRVVFHFKFISKHSSLQFRSPTTRSNSKHGVARTLTSQKYVSLPLLVFSGTPCNV